MGLTTKSVNNIGKVKNEIDEKYGGLHTSVMKDDYWEGEGAAALRDKYHIIKRDIDKQLDQLVGLIRDYNRLQGAVDQAEQERLRKIEEARVKTYRGYDRNM